MVLTHQLSGDFLSEASSETSLCNFKTPFYDEVERSRLFFFIEKQVQQMIGQGVMALD